jgi:hypothetical protein
MRPLRQRNGSRVIVSPPRETGGGFFMSKRKSGDHAAESPSPPEIVCILVVDAIIDEFEVEICCQRTDGVDRVFSTSMDWLRAERPSEYTLAYSVETLLFSIIARCLRYVGEPVDVRAGLLLQSRRRHRRTRRVRCPEKEYSCRFHRRTNLTLTS